jgi:hypothetical protein
MLLKSIILDAGKIFTIYLIRVIAIATIYKWFGGRGRGRYKCYMIQPLTVLYKLSRY